MSENNFEIPTDGLRKNKVDQDNLRDQFQNDLRREADLIRLEFNEQFKAGNSSRAINGTSNQHPTQPAILPGMIQITNVMNFL